MIVPSEKAKKSLKAAAKAYRDQLLQDDEALTYLNARNFTSEAISHFGLGVVREAAPGHETFRNRLSFPYICPGGIVTSIRFRHLGEEVPKKVSKFISLTGDSARLYNVTAVIDQSKVFVCEGETDTITAWMAGLPTIGIPGATSWKPAFSRVLRNREVVVLADNDDGGEGKKFADQIYRELDGCDIILMDKGHDVTSFVGEHGLDRLREKVGL